MKIAEAKQMLQLKLDEIEQDERYKAKPALVQVNAPLALTQCSLAGQASAFKYAIALLNKVK